MITLTVFTGGIQKQTQKVVIITVGGIASAQTDLFRQCNSARANSNDSILGDGLCCINHRHKGNELSGGPQEHRMLGLAIPGPSTQRCNKTDPLSS